MEYFRKKANKYSSYLKHDRSGRVIKHCTEDEPIKYDNDFENYWSDYWPDMLAKVKKLKEIKKKKGLITFRDLEKIFKQI